MQESKAAADGTRRMSRLASHYYHTRTTEIRLQCLAEFRPSDPVGPALLALDVEIWLEHAPAIGKTLFEAVADFVEAID